MRIHVLLALCSSVAFASEFDEAFISEIVSNEHVCVRAYDKDRIYLNPERIIPTQKGLFLALANEGYLPLPPLHLDQNGYYIQSVRASDSWSIYWTCPVCGTVNGMMDNRCRNASCPSNSKPRK